VSQASITINVLGLDLTFKPGADMERVHEVMRLVDRRFKVLKSQGGRSKETNLTLLVLEMADDVLKLKKELDDLKQRISSIVKMIESSGNQSV
jgi:cell division protein ZapA